MDNKNFNVADILIKRRARADILLNRYLYPAFDEGKKIDEEFLLRLFAQLNEILPPEPWTEIDTGPVLLRLIRNLEKAKPNFEQLSDEQKRLVSRDRDLFYQLICLDLESVDTKLNNSIY